MTSVAPESWNAPEVPPGARPPEPPPRDGADAWPAWTAPVALVSGLIGAFVGGLLVLLIASAFGVDVNEDDPQPGIVLGSSLALDISLIGAAIVFARMTGPVGGAHFGLRPTAFGRAFVGVIATYVGFVILASAWGALVGDPGDEPLLDDLGVDESTLLLVLGALTVCVGAPLVEELFFRGFFYRALRNAAGVAGAAILTGLVFAAMHLTSSPIEHIVPLAVLGTLFCLLYQYTGSLYPCIALHAINNSIAFGIAKDWGWEIAPLVVASLAVCGLIAWTTGRLWRPRMA